ncbi:hypothetical protein [Kitasatospora sp. NPDC059827]|uniref:hypothetical protein n=1 Tax=Kitasatospora sp. NPDC059827 TaxID=3346964 RepID=UPI0036668BDB
MFGRARVLRPGGALIASTNSDTDKQELDQLWAKAAGDVLGIPEGPARVSLSSRFSLEKVRGYLWTAFKDIRIRELPGTIEITDLAPIVAYLSSYEAWADQCGVPFRETIGRAAEIAAVAIEVEGSFKITCLGGILICRPWHLIRWHSSSLIKSFRSGPAFEIISKAGPMFSVPAFPAAKRNSINPNSVHYC